MSLLALAIDGTMVRRTSAKTRAHRPDGVAAAAHAKTLLLSHIAPGQASPIHERSTRQHGEAMVAGIGIRVHRVRDRAVGHPPPDERGKTPWSEHDGGDETCGTGPDRS